LLVELGARVNARAPNGATPLMMASREAHRDTVRWLLDHGADPNLKTDSNATAFDWAIKYHSPEIARMLRDAGNQPCSTGSARLQEANAAC
jgi:uncharacterized protein